MKISCFPNSYGRFGVEAALAHLPEIGVKWLELPIKNGGMPSFFKETPLVTDKSSVSSLAYAKELIDASGLELSSCNITSGNPLQREVLDRTLVKLAIAHRFGVSLVVGGGGEISSEADWPVLIQNLRMIGDDAAQQGITYCCETHPGTCQNAERMLELMERVDHPHVRLNFDTGNLFYYNELPNVLEEYRKVAANVSHIHLKDTNGVFKEWHFPALGAGGAVDFQAFRELLQATNYNGPLSLEVEGIEGEPELSLEETQQRLSQSVEHLRECGFEIS